MKVSRRKFLAGTAATVAAGAIPAALLFRRTEARGESLVRDPEGILDLPPGFSYRVVERAGDAMSDGLRVPGLPDGMACFAGPEGEWILMRNHELPLGMFELAAYSRAHIPEHAYDAHAVGGVSRVRIDPASRERLSSNLVLAGTERNCAGGPSPWGWLTCEESVRPGHGYVFRCRIDAEAVAPVERIPGYGRFNHEAVAVDPKTHVAYLTEDRGDGCLYRFVPHRPDVPFEGRLQAMRVRGRPAMDTGRAALLGRELEVEWVDLEEIDPPDDTLRVEARSKGAATVRRGEGIWYGDDGVVFTATSGGPVEAGQIFRLRIGRDGAPDTLELLAESEDRSQLDMPDNVTIAPWGDIVVAEDGLDGQFVRVLDQHGRLHDLAFNALSTSEFTGVCFSPDASALFVNIQLDGLTLMVEGPFENLTGRHA